MDSWNNMGLFSTEINTENQVFENMVFPPFSQESESNCGIDLKLGGQTFDPDHNISGSDPSKRPRETGFGLSTPICKVLGCNKNLSNCKEYHKRHKVCEVHTKTSKVIVNGIEQRFCQQCSRFHLLLEFDDGKRSCRKRLAGHNERRRKQNVGPFSERHRRFLPSFNISVEGNPFKRSPGAISSFSIPYDYRIPYQQKYETNGRWQANLEDRTPHDLQSISCITDERLPFNFETNPRFDGIVNGFIGASSSESSHSLLSYQSQNTSCYYEPNQVLGVEGSLVKFGIMGSDRAFPDQGGGTIDLLQLSSQLERVEHQKQQNSTSE